MRILALFALTMIATGVQAGAYKCKDQTGALVYQDTPCARGKEPAALNPNAGYATSDSDSVHQESNRLRAEHSAQQRARDSQAEMTEADQGTSDSSGRLVPDDKCYTGVWKNRTWGCPYKRYETADEAAMRESRMQGQPAYSPPPPSTSTGPRITNIQPGSAAFPGMVKDNAGNRYQYDGAGRPVDRQTGKVCQQKGEKVICW